MKKTIATMIFSGMVCIGTHALADDSTSPQAMKPDDTQAMQDCLAKQKAANASMTQAAMETVCKNQAKKSHKKAGNDLITGPQSPKQDQQPPQQ